MLVKADAVLSRVCNDSPQFARYLGIGIVATLVDWTIFYLLIGYPGHFLPGGAGNVLRCQYGTQFFP